MKTKFTKFLFFWIIILSALACGLGDGLSTPLPVNPPLEPWTPVPSVIPRQPRTPTPTPISLFPTPVAIATFPAWVADFSDPILSVVEDQYPVFEDHFPAICIDERKRWKVCSTPERRTYYQANDSEEIPTSISELPLATARPTLDLQPDLQNGYILLNKSWFYFSPDNLQQPLYAYIDYGVLILTLPTGKENKDLWVYNPKFQQENFVLQFDLEFRESQPKDTFRFQFDQDLGRSVAFDLSKNQNWTLRWGPLSAWQSKTGTYSYFPPVPITVLIIAKGQECAVYLNHAPLVYLADCRTGPNVRPSPWSMTFHLLAEPGHTASVAIDNVKMWDLDDGR